MIEKAICYDRWLFCVFRQIPEHSCVACSDTILLVNKRRMIMPAIAVVMNHQGRAYMLMLLAMMAAANPTVSQLSQYFAYNKTLTGNVPSTTDAFSVLQVSLKAPQNIRSPMQARFVLPNNTYALYNYQGYSGGAHRYLVAVPKAHSGSVSIQAHIDARFPVTTTQHRTESQLLSNTVILGANDIFLLVDVSGSMSSAVPGGLTRMQVAQNVVNQIAPQLQSMGNNVGVIQYNSSSTVRTGLDQKFSSLSFSAGGGTGTHDAVARAISLMNGRPSPGKIIIDVTDGVPNSHALLEAQVNIVKSRANQGWAFAGIGIGLDVPSYYPIRQKVSSSNAQFALGNTILDVVKTAEEQVRDVNGICSGDKCDMVANDTEKPLIYMDTASECPAPITGTDMSFRITDNRAGINMAGTTFRIQFYDGSVYNLPVNIKNRAAYDAKVAAGLSVLEVELAVNESLMRQSGLMQKIEEAYYAPEAIGGKQPYTVLISAVDRDGNRRDFSRTVVTRVTSDVGVPGVEVTTESAGAGGLLNMLHTQDLKVAVTDDRSGIHERDVRMTLKYKGQAIPLDMHIEAKGNTHSNVCYARMPLRIDYDATNRALESPQVIDVVSDAYLTDSEMELVVEVTDFAGNSYTHSQMLKFAPEVHTAKNTHLPGLMHEFTPSRKDHTLSISGRELDYGLVGDVTYFARLSGAEDMEFEVNGTHVRHDQIVSLGTYDLKGQLGFNFKPLEDQVVGSAEIILFPNNVGARVVKIPVTTWVPDMTHTVSNETPVQLFEATSVRVKNQDEGGCHATGQENYARMLHDPITNPNCFIRWNVLPRDTYPLEQNQAQMNGFIPDSGVQKFEYEIMFYDPKTGAEFSFGTQEGSVDVIPAKDVMKFTVGNGMDGTYRIIQEVEARLTQKEGPMCGVLTLDAQAVQDSSMRNRPGCEVTWEEIPNGHQAAGWTDDPITRGRFIHEEGDATFKWSIHSYTTSGERMLITQETQIIPLADPPLPSITFTDKNKVSDEPLLYYANKEGDHVGDYMVEAVTAELVTELWKDGELLNRDTAFGGYGNTMRYQSRLITHENELWHRDAFVIKAYYKVLPRLVTEEHIPVVYVPNDNIRPNAEAATNRILNIDTLGVRSWIHNPYDPGMVYDPKENGDWLIQLVDYQSYSSRVPVTDYMPVDENGEIDFNLNLLSDEKGFIRILPRAQLVSKAEGYSREVFGSAPLYITILRGEAIQGNIDARRIMGEAPLPMLMMLNLENRLDYDALGDITWQIREKGSSQWNDFAGREGMEQRFYHTFEKGEYEVRAHIVNKYSKRESHTETIEVHAFNVPQVKINGPSNVFIGDTGRFEAVAKINGEVIDEEAMIFEWSEDNGETWTTGGAKYTLTRDEEDRVPLISRIRLKESPEDFEQAINETRMRVAFRPVRAPRPGIYGSSVIESGQEVEWRGMKRAPYPNMDVEVRGHFVLPDGSTYEGEMVSYTGTDEDAAKERIEVKYVAWVEGFEDQGAYAETTKRVRVWEYEWPNWSFYTRSTSSQAPAEVSMRMRSLSGNTRYLEELTFEWEVPEGVEVIDDYHADGRSFAIKEPGTYPIVVKISDGRGFESILTENVELSPADPWVLGMRLSPSNPDFRAPLSLRLIPDISGGHPRDRLEQYRYYLNGDMISENQRYGSMNLEEGEYQIELEIESSHGITKRESFPVEVLPNLPPTCQLTVRESSSGWRFAAGCQDEDGYIARHVWTLNGEQIATSASRISVTVRGDEPQNPTVTLEAVDNGGARSDTITWSSTSGVMGSN
jgi:hypothetical protein